MPITKEKFKGKEYLIASGKVTGAYVNDIAPDKIKTYAGPQGPWTPTKRLKIVVDGIDISLGMSDKDTIRAKDADGKYHDVVKGVEVSVEVTENGEYNGKPQYQAKIGGITVVDVSGAEAPTKAGGASQGQAAQPFKAKDMTGIQVGHAINGALSYITSNGLEIDNAFIVEVAKVVNEATEDVRTVYKQRNPGMNDYDLGAATGHAVLNACRLVAESEVAELKGNLVTVAFDLLDNVVTPITEYIKQGQKAPEAKASPVAAKKAVTSKAKILPKATPKPVVEDERPEPPDGFEDMDVPF